MECFVSFSQSQKLHCHICLEIFSLYATGFYPTWSALAVIMESLMKPVLGICGFFSFFIFAQSHPTVLEHPSLTIDKVISKGTHFLICIFCCLLKMWPLDGAILSDCSLSPVLAAGWQVWLQETPGTYCCLSSRGKGHLARADGAGHRGFLRCYVRSFILLSWKIATNSFSLRRGSV